jgi:prepilin-type N-terminal cleavage/methylation domain-containing protein
VKPVARGQAGSDSPSPGKLTPPATRHPSRAFTLLEVMIAVAILFICLFAILDLTNQSLRAARVVQQANMVDFTSAAAELMLTNRIEEGTYTGDFGEAHPDHDWTADVFQVATNGLFQVDFVVREQVRSWDRRPRLVETKSSILLYRPESAVSGLGAGRR